jgi:hypothetical protein
MDKVDKIVEQMYSLGLNLGFKHQGDQNFK